MTLSEQRQSLITILNRGAVNSLFQPIVSTLEERIVGFEALSRGPSNSPLHSPLTLFAAARHHGILTELEMLCRERAISRFRSLGLPGKLFLNVSPESLLEQQHYRGQTLALLEANGLSPDQIVIELTEQAPIEDLSLLQSALLHYRDMGFSIALDDLGAGYSSLRLWSELQPEYVKIDRHFVDGIHRDPVKREFVSSILQMAKASRAQVIAEGIELREELAVLQEIGIDWVQGYLLGRPDSHPALNDTKLAELLGQHQSGGNDDAPIHSLLLPVGGIPEHTKVQHVLDCFQQQPSLNTLAIVDEHQRPIGAVQRHALSQTMLKPFAQEIYSRKPINQLMDPDCLVVDIRQSLQRVSRLLTSRARQRLEDDFIIVDQGVYKGLGRGIDVLRQITELKLQQARHANPLTLLPGNIPIQQCLQRLLEQAVDARLCYIDLDNFKPFNDLYGYGKGDEVLLGLAQLLRELCDPRCDFVGHIGGDDFMLVMRSSDWSTRLQQLDQRFAQLCRSLYRPEHIQANGFTAPDREGKWRHHDLLNLSIGVIPLLGHQADRFDPSRLAELASRAKHDAKKQRGFSVVVQHLTLTPFDNSETPINLCS
ncbi:bifunctional diguanylate cyclase/phosphodiesterase [Halopseudomonas maritima]|uniref:bifunctional diguanylate cyclase/phosphodiesterase n=1 Tax=Halopseudomonas maritima TaxID=2918528 RepID=UPI001EECF2F0|nr:bifunctional diguanylate cyclase/phosphodiesterase [Halopseudomonas maritima]UJJ32182.1 EAL and GGDEF domain-containing protein [Halopseudomonas maritima]